ncbi:hypothetical protein VP01_2418g1 [Puccinia sorghi]|uniref:Mitochondrial protein n=1 Tax=Puccinia sorghi TaxID=27349 RepID=A0A0L6V6J9_9BASI|nr:hypothetical protein VP01_2418g1 [Puccinia sorghi]
MAFIPTTNPRPLNRPFSVPNLLSGVPNTLFGMKYKRVGNKTCLSQPKHINHGLEKLEASDDDHEKFKQLNINYCSAVGLLNYIASNTRPDLSFAMSNLARYSVKSGLTHWKEFTIDPVRPTEFLSIYSDATWGDNPDSRTSQSGYLCDLFGSLISWNSCKQCSITYSSTEAELNPLVESFHEGVWLKSLINKTWEIQIESQN